MPIIMTIAQEKSKLKRIKHIKLTYVNDKGMNKMKYHVTHIIGAMVAIPIAFLTGFISMSFFNLDAWIDFALISTGFIGSFIPIQQNAKQKYLKEIGLTFQEYKYVRKSLKEAQPKVKLLLTQYKNIRSIQEFKSVNDINKLVRTIYKTVQKEPRRFFKVDSFFFSHLDNTINLMQQYLFLSRMPHKSEEDIKALNMAKLTLEELKRTLQADLRQLNRQDYQNMQVEVEVFKKQSQDHFLTNKKIVKDVLDENRFIE